MNTTLHKIFMIWAIVLIMGLLYACSDTVNEGNTSTNNGDNSSTPTLTAEDITYDKDRVVQGIADTATPTSSTISDFSGLIFTVESINAYVGTGTQVLPTIAEGGIITTTATTSAGSYKVTIAPDGSTILGNPITVNFYVTVKAMDTADLDTKLAQAIANYGLTGDFNYIDTSDVTDMSYLFRSGYTPGTGATDSTRTYVEGFNGDISQWDVSAVTDFSNMFNGAADFSQDLSDWSVDSTDTTIDMFKDSGIASLPNWYTPPTPTPINLDDITYNKIAQGSVGLTKPISATITDFSGLNFALSSISPYVGTGTQVLPDIAEDGTITTDTTTTAGSYRVTITPDGNIFTGDPFTVDFYVTVKPANIGELDTILEQAVEDYSLTGDFNYIDTSIVTDMSHLFRSGRTPGTGAADSTRTYIEGFNGDISKWDVSSVTNFADMFNGAAFNQDIGGWIVSSGTSFSNMFSEATKFNQDIGRWNVSAGIIFKSMFSGATAFNQNIGQWIVSKGENFNFMFSGAENFNQNINEWDISAGKYFVGMFNGAKKFNQNIAGWIPSSAESFNSMFAGAIVFDQDISGWSVGTVINFGSMFNGATAFNQDLSGWNLDSSSVNISNMFLNSGVTNLPSWYTP